LKIETLLVHFFDGEAIDLLLQQLDTAPDFLAYLTGRANALASSTWYRFAECDLLAESILNWAAGSGLSPSVPMLDMVREGAWDNYYRSERAERSANLNAKSRTIDNIIEHFHETYEAQTFLNQDPPEILEHEKSLRMLASESRYASRMVVAALYEILEELDQSRPWSSTIPSPTTAGLRYVWLIYPDPPEDVSAAEFERMMFGQLRHQILRICGEFGAECIMGIVLPNGKGAENYIAMTVFDGSKWTDEDREQARLLKEEGLFGDHTRVDYLHVP
jgi:hypothetical protein